MDTHPCLIGLRPSSVLSFRYMSTVPVDDIQVEISYCSLSKKPALTCYHCDKVTMVCVVQQQWCTERVKSVLVWSVIASGQNYG